MIVTFHIVVYLAYYVWENYISGSTRNERDNDGVNENSDNPSTSENVNAANEPRLLSQPSRTESNLFSRQDNQLSRSESDKSKQANHGEGDPHPCILHIPFYENDVGRRRVYNTEPTFESYYTSEKQGLKFIPPVYVQRYMVIDGILKSSSWCEHIKKVVDFGCAELSFVMKHLKKISGIEEIVAVDIDSALLKYNSCKVSPTPIDYLDPRPTPLTIRVYCGSVGNTNEALVGTDAVIAIELIEHLYPNDLENLPFTVFGYMKPKIAMFTTPNADFNVLFPNFTGFRHLDHKFEWSREQFEDWGKNIVQRYPEYQVVFQGVGPGPKGTEHLGCCSQMAVFTKMFNTDLLNDDEIHVQDGQYMLIEESVFPFFVEQRTREEIIRDDAVSFINRWKMLSRTHDEELRKEIPLMDIMERIKCFSKDRLKDVLTKDNWKIETNKEGYEVVVIPYSDSEESEDEEDIEIDEIEKYFNEDDVHCCVQDVEEYWDDETDNLMNSNSESVGEQACFLENQQIVDSSNADSANQSVGDVKTSEICSNTRLNVLDSNSFLTDKSNSSPIDISKHDPNTSLESSVYETPYNNGCEVLKPKCDLFKSSEQSVDEDRYVNGCKKALDFEFSDNCKECEHRQVSKQIDSYCCLSSIPSSSEMFPYSSPCCSQPHKHYIPKCLSLQQINGNCSYSSHNSKLDSFSSSNVSVGKNRFSQSVEDFKVQENCDMHETGSNASRIIDSGYPDSYSEHNMDLDLTPEQFDDIETESEGNDVSSRSLSPLLPAAPQMPHLINAVENGDVANNNRDGEGNNMVADMEEEALEFEAHIEEVVNEVPNLAVAYSKDDEILESFNTTGSEHNKINCTDDIQIRLNSECLDSSLLYFKEEYQNSSLLRRNENAAERKAHMETSDISDISSMKDVKSGSSVDTNSSWGHFSSLDSSTSLGNKVDLKFNISNSSPQSIAHNSLTTVLDGCSKFSNCSLISPNHKDNLKLFKNNSNRTDLNVFPDWMLSIDNSLFEISKHYKQNISSVGKTLCYDPSQQDRLSIRSVYESAESLNAIVVDLDLERGFPSWLLDMDLSDDENELNRRNSVLTIWDWEQENYDGLDDMNYDVQVDVRAGGDPQGETLIMDLTLN